MAWHCLNCESVSLLAPIYKGTLARERSCDSAIEPRPPPLQQQLQQPTPTTTAMLQPRASAEDQSGGFKCYLCMYRTKPAAQVLLANSSSSSTAATPAVDEPQRCRHHHMRMRAKHMRFPLPITDQQQQPGRQQSYGMQQMHNQHHQQQQHGIVQQSQRSSLGQPLPSHHHHHHQHHQQKSFDGVPPVQGLYYSNRRINKSLSSITDFVGSSASGQQMMGSEFYDTVFGEHIGGGIRAQKGFAATVLNNEPPSSRQLLRRSLSKGSESPAAQSPFDQWPAAVPMTTSPTAAGGGSIVDYGRTRSPATESIGGGSSSGGGTGHFTITTLSRSGDSSRSTTASKRSLPRNGGVFVAVGSWSVAPVVAAEPSPDQTSQDTLGYEILKNPYAGGAANHFYENQPKKVQTILNEPQPLEPIYAVVNKINKLRAAKAAAADKHQARAFDALNASIDQQQQQQPHELQILAGADADRVDGCGQSASTSTTAEQSTSSYITISSGVQEPGSDTSDIYAKVWKGPRNALDSQRK